MKKKKHFTILLYKLYYGVVTLHCISLIETVFTYCVQLLLKNIVMEV